MLGDAVCYVNPFDADDIAKATTKIITDKSFRETLIDNGVKKLNETKANNDFSTFFKIINNYRKIQKLWNFN